MDVANTEVTFSPELEFINYYRNMKKKFLFPFIVSVVLTPLAAQTLTLEQCQQLARENYPLVSQRGLIEKTSEFTVANAKRNWLPQISLSAQATYQSDVVTIPQEVMDMMGELKDNPLVGQIIDVPDMNYDGIPKDQYKAAIEVQQIIYGGGAVKAQVEAAKAQGEADKQNWETEMYSLRERVNQLYFGTLLLQEKGKEVDLMINELERNKTLVQSCVELGVAGQSDVDKLQVEILSARQQQSEINASLKAYRIMLGIMMGQDINESTEFLKPAMSVLPSELQINRPELKFLDAQQQLLDAQKRGVDAAIKPQIGAFFQGAYSNVGLDMFSTMMHNEWTPYFIAGIQLKWNISGFYNRKSDLSKINNARSQLALQRETFLYNMNLKSRQEQINIERMHNVMEQDDEIIRLRTAIRERAAAGVENGSTTVNDLLREIHAENLARQNKVTHEIELLKDIYDLKHTVGDHQE